MYIFKKVWLTGDKSVVEDKKYDPGGFRCISSKTPDLSRY